MVPSRPAVGGYHTTTKDFSLSFGQYEVSSFLQHLFRGVNDVLECTLHLWIEDGGWRNRVLV